MKKVILYGLLSFSSLSYSQLVINDFVPISGMGQYQRVGLNNSDNLNINDIKGSPYIDKNFKAATIGDNETVYGIRYNAVLDEMEFRDENDQIYHVNKNANNKIIHFVTENIKFVFLKYINIDNKTTEGYLMELHQDRIGFFKREIIVFKNAKAPTSGYGEATPHRFERANDEYYIKLNNETVIAFPKNKKEYLSLFNDYKKELEDYFKKNKVSFKNESDMMSLFMFTNNLMKSS